MFIQKIGCCTHDRYITVSVLTLSDKLSSWAKRLTTYYSVIASIPEAWYSLNLFREHRFDGKRENLSRRHFNWKGKVERNTSQESLMAVIRILFSAYLLSHFWSNGKVVQHWHWQIYRKNEFDLTDQTN